MAINKWSPNVAEMRIGMKGSAKNRFVRQREKKRNQICTYEGKVLVLIEALIHCDTKIAEMDI